ncbi:hypothetical protein EDC01DRAFT_378457 [Geopyxis carbonaria]|nr:hypothetical protein EDC01DRAFT_378457 [Geopyxis carbonaria]
MRYVIGTVRATDFSTQGRLKGINRNVTTIRPKARSTRSKAPAQAVLTTFGFAPSPHQSPDISKQSSSMNTCNRPNKRIKAISPDITEIPETQFAQITQTPSQVEPNEKSSDEDEQLPEPTPHFTTQTKDKTPGPTPGTPKRPLPDEIPSSYSPQYSETRHFARALRRNSHTTPSKTTARTPRLPTNGSLKTPPTAVLNLGSPIKTRFTIEDRIIKSSQWYENEDIDDSFPLSPVTISEPQTQSDVDCKVSSPGHKAEQIKQPQPITNVYNQSYLQIKSPPQVEPRVQLTLGDSHTGNLQAELESPLCNKPLSQNTLARNPDFMSHRLLEDIEAECEYTTPQSSHSERLPTPRSQLIEDVGSETESEDESQDPSIQFRPVRTQQYPFDLFREGSSLSAFDATSPGIDSQEPLYNYRRSPSNSEQDTQFLRKDAPENVEKIEIDHQSLHRDRPSRHAVLSETQLLPESLMETFPMPPPFSQQSEFSETQ